MGISIPPKKNGLNVQPFRRQCGGIDDVLTWFLRIGSTWNLLDAYETRKPENHELKYPLVK